jgi:hypothetical protein
MKLIKNLGVFVLLVMAVSSCKKSDNSPAPGSVTGYPKTVVISQSGESITYTLTYDASNRVTQLNQAIVDSSSTTNNQNVAVTYAYTGSSTWPSSSSTTLTIPSQSVTVPYTDNYTYNSQNQVTVDTVIFGGSYATAFSGVSYFTYPTGQTLMANELTVNQKDSQYVYIDTLEFTGQNATYYSQVTYTTVVGGSPTSGYISTESLTVTKYLNPLAKLPAFSLFVYNPTAFTGNPTILNVDLPLTETYQGSNILNDTYTFDGSGRVLQLTGTETSGSGYAYTETFTY